MQKIILRLLLLFAFFQSFQARACPFCELGSNDAAYFIVAIIGTFSLAAGCLFFVFRRRVQPENDQRLASRALEAEGMFTDEK